MKVLSWFILCFSNLEWDNYFFCVSGKPIKMIRTIITVVDSVFMTFNKNRLVWGHKGSYLELLFPSVSLPPENKSVRGDFSGM